jgi:hypothetical protein
LPKIHNGGIVPRDILIARRKYMSNQTRLRTKILVVVLIPAALLLLSCVLVGIQIGSGSELDTLVYRLLVVTFAYCFSFGIFLTTLTLLGVTISVLKGGSVPGILEKLWDFYTFFLPIKSYSN